MINNFRELSMREARRCDLRNGINMKSLAQQQIKLEQQWKVSPNHDHVSDGVRKTASGFDGNDSSNNPCNLRYHPSILSLLQNVMYRSGGEDEKGNWGRFKVITLLFSILNTFNFYRWNFGGKGPESGPPPINAGHIGAIMSLPGSGDQTIHADTSHLFVHTQVL
jgi:hypothetical protein